MRKFLVLFMAVMFLLPCVVIGAEKNVGLVWEQADLTAVAGWELHRCDANGNNCVLFERLPYTGTPAPEYEITKSLTVPDGQVSTVCFKALSYSAENMKSGWSNTACGTWDFRIPGTPVNVRFKVVTQ